MAEYVNKAESKQAVRDKWQNFETRVEVNYIVNCMPTIDIVHCKDCKYYSEWSDGEKFCGHLDGMGAHDYGFCSDGERRSDG